MRLASAGGAITPTGIRIMVSYLDQTGLEHTLEKLRNQMYPVGSLYFSTNSTSPATIYGGTWERYGKGRTLVSVNESDTDFTAGKTGGEKTHVLTVDEMPSHRHEVRKFATMQGGGTWDIDKIGGSQYNDNVPLGTASGIVAQATDAYPALPRKVQVHGRTVDAHTVEPEKLVVAGKNIYDESYKTT